MFGSIGRLLRICLDAAFTYAVSGPLAVYTLFLNRIKQSYAGLLGYWVQYLAHTHHARIPTFIDTVVSIGVGIRNQGLGTFLSKPCLPLFDP